MSGTEYKPCVKSHRTELVGVFVGSSPPQVSGRVGWWGNPRIRWRFSDEVLGFIDVSLELQRLSLLWQWWLD
jgi:hypothetical protein